jgi:hypothetical protein
MLTSVTLHGAVRSASASDSGRTRLNWNVVSSSSNALDMILAYPFVVFGVVTISDFGWR